jgi:glycosyltransferase involved in cell wall biosynthesis
VDRLVLSERRVFGWGWVADEAQPVTAAYLRIRGEAWERRLTADYGLARSDVEQAFPQLVRAGSSGFVVTGYVPEGAAQSLALEVELADGSRVEADVSQLAEHLYGRRKTGRQIGWLAQAVWRRLKRGDVMGIVRRARAQNLGAPSVDDLNILPRLLPLLRACRDLCIVFDHSMGGGSNQYRRRMVEERLAAGQSVLLCTYNMPLLGYRLHLLRPGEDEQVLAMSGFQVLEAVIDKAPVSEIFLNSPVSFDEPLVLAEWLARMRADFPRVRLTVTAHDFFAVCPSFVLLNADGRFCGIPDLAECGSCLKRHRASYVSLSPPTEIGPWRALWGRCLEAADEVRCFSESTRMLLRRAYPALAPERLTLVPHKVDYVPARRPHHDPRAPLVVGIVGEISPQKGALVVRDMIEIIEREGLDVRVVVVGTLDVVCKSPRLHVTGRYRREDLVELIERHGINMFLFPSIWPETFSYVVAEMIQLGLPIVAFDLGAPVERLRRYGKARLCDETSAPAALRTLVDFHRQLAAEEAAAA